MPHYFCPSDSRICVYCLSLSLWMSVWLCSFVCIGHEAWNELFVSYYAVVSIRERIRDFVRTKLQGSWDLADRLLSTNVAASCNRLQRVFISTKARAGCFIDFRSLFCHSPPAMTLCLTRAHTQDNSAHCGRRISHDCDNFQVGAAFIRQITQPV